MGEVGPFRECRIKSIIASIFLNLCCYQYWKESFTVQGFTGGNLTCKGLLCLEQSKMRGKSNKYSEQSGWEHRAGSGCRAFQVPVTNLSAPSSSSALCWVCLVQRGNSVCLHYKQAWVWSMHRHTWGSTYRKKRSSVNNSRKTAIEKCNI